jgi:hypothetical protein
MDEPTIHIDILRRYDDFLAKKTKKIECISVPGYTYPHLRWMIREIVEGRTVGDKAHRWLGFIQGVLIREDHFKVATERDFTRPYFTKIENEK